MPPSVTSRTREFLEIKSRQELAEWLGLSDKALRFLLYKLPEQEKYKSFEIPKRNGGVRRIDAPQHGLKSLQSLIAREVSEISPPRDLAFGYVKKRSIFGHARIHRSKRWVVLADIKSFFPTINFGRVRGLFLAPPYRFTPEVATCLAQLCCKDGALPQGSPASPAISNAICRKLDREILNLAKICRCQISRYADDICFSTNRKSVSNKIAEFIPDFGYVPGAALANLVRKNGFAINPEKFKVINQRERMLVTGLVVNKGVSIPRTWRRQLRSVMHLVSKFGSERASKISADWNPRFLRPSSTNFEQSLRGKLRFVRWVDVVAGRSVTRSLYRNYPKLRSYLPRIDPKFSIRLLSEGDSDLLHLEAAFRSLKEARNFDEINPRFHNYSGDKGDAELWQTLLRIAKVDVDELTIGIFDCDNLGFLKKNGLGPGTFIKLGPMVFALCLSQPNEATLPPYCIESLYPRSEATRLDGSGRRLFFKDEFNDDGSSKDGMFLRDFPLSQSLVVGGNVTEVATGASVLLGKMAFARSVAEASPPFDGMNFSGFLPTFKMIEKLVYDVASLRGMER